MRRWVRVFLALLIAVNLAVVGLWHPPAVAAATGFPTFCDIRASDPAYGAVTTLAALEIVRGYENGCFGPGDTVLRAQMAALIARAMVWDSEVRGNPFPDRNGVDDGLWQAVGTLAGRGVVRGYPDGTFDPTGAVLHAQTISFITRAMVSSNLWLQQQDDPNLYPEVPLSSGHRTDIATYVAYAGALPDRPITGALDWDQPSSRAWFARALWQALNWQVRAGLDAEESSFLTIINLYRQRNGVGPLALSGPLIAAAKWMSADLMVRVKTPADFSHADSFGRESGVRLCAFGYCFNTWTGENIAAGNATAAATFVQWRDSDGHRANMLRPEFATIGIGRAQGGYYGWYWTTDFGGQ
ncbi:MAG TPA: S-layer homology domain-containing protein [Thermomicrobiales bacterium]